MGGLLLRWFTPKGKREDELEELTDFGPGVYKGMIEELRKEALHRAIGPRERHRGYWYSRKSGFGEAHWPATSIDAEYASMTVANDYRLSTSLRDHPCPPEVVSDLAARLHEQIRIMRGLGPRPLAPAERVPMNVLIDEARRGFARFGIQQHPVSGKRLRDVVRSSRRDVARAITRSYPHAAFEILRTMPEAEQYVPAELLDPYQEWTVGGQMYFHQMFGHGSGLQDAPRRYEDAGVVLLLQIAGSPTLGFAQNAILHYWIPGRDLARGRFDRVEGTWETD